MSESSALNLSSVPVPGDRFYQTVWRWHFYAGLFVIPFMLILAVTGIIYLFKPQLDVALYRNWMFVQPSAVMLHYSEQVQAARQVYPDATVSQFTPNVAGDRSAEVGLTTADEQDLIVFVNPYTRQVLGSQDEDNNLQAIVRTIHGNLMLGTRGEYLVELAACWGLVLLISGLYLWLPRSRFSVFGTLIPRLRFSDPNWASLVCLLGRNVCSSVGAFSCPNVGRRASIDDVDRFTQSNRAGCPLGSRATADATVKFCWS
jgi:hypothetical protein